MREYLLRIKGAEFPYMDPDIPNNLDKLPFEFKLTNPHFPGAPWATAAKGKALWLSPEPPGLQVSFEGTSVKEEREILKHLQKGIDKETVIIQIQ